MEKIEEILYKQLRKHAPIPCGIVIALSGGVDSMALLGANSAIAEKLGIRPVALWVNHGLRPKDELECEYEIVRTTCERMNVPLKTATAERGSIELQAHNAGTGIEAAARKFRYKALMDCARSETASLVLTAHTFDDTIETVLMRLFRGSGAGGLSGISERRSMLLRPFLSCTKRDLVAYCRKRDIPWNEDSTNASSNYLRNRIRKELIPCIASIFPGYDKALRSFMQKNGMDESALSSIATRIGRIQSANGSASCELGSFSDALPALRYRMLQQMALKTGITELSYRSVRGVLIEKSLKTTRLDGKGFGLFIDTENGSISMENKRLLDQENEINKSSTEWSLTLCDRDLESPINIDIGDARRLNIFMSDTERGIRESKFSYPVIVRSRCDGDRIAMKNGNKYIDTHLIEELGFPPSLADSCIVVEDRNGIVAVLGSFCGYKDYFAFRPSMDNSCSYRYLVIRQSTDFASARKEL